MKRKKAPQKLCTRISEADQNRLRLHFADLATQAADRHGVKVFQIRKPSMYRARAVCRAREEVVLGLRGSVWYRDNSGNRYLAIGLCPSFSKIEVPWESISTPMIAALFPCDHSAIVLFLQDEKRCRAAAKRLACLRVYPHRQAEHSDTESSDDWNRNSDSSGRVCGWCDGSDAGQSGAESPKRACEAAT